jgi:RHS repeat-associated protein
MLGQKLSALISRLPAVIVLLITSVAQGQITSVGDTTSTPIPGVGHDYIKMLSETVNPANGSVSVRIAVPVPPGRGLTIPFSFGYDSNGVNPLYPQPNGEAIAEPLNSYLSQGGWSYILPEITYTLGTQTEGKYTCPFYTAYTMSDSQGSRYSLSVAYTPTEGGICSDESKTTATGGVYSASILDTNRLLITDEEGTIYSLSANGGCEAPGSYFTELPYSVEDRNGNTVTLTPTQCNGAFTVSDTVGRVAISSSGFGATGNTLTVPGLGSYSLNWGGTATGNYTIGYTNSGSTQYCYGLELDAQSGSSVISAITLPNNQQYTFTYDPTYGLLNKIEYPTGATVTYSWGLNTRAEYISYTDSNGDHHGCNYTYDTPAITHRYVSFNGTTTALQQDFTYSTTWNSTNSSWTQKTTSVTTHDLVRGASYTTNYTYLPIGAGIPPLLFDSIAGQIPQESSIVYNDYSGATLETVNKAWSGLYDLVCQSTSLGSSSSNPCGGGTPNSTTSYVTYVYHAVGSVTNKTEYDFGKTSPSRVTVTNYQTFAASPIYQSPAIIDRPCQVITYDGSNDRYAETDYYYDNGSTGTVCGTAGAPSVTGVSNLVSGTHDETNYSPTSTAPRGNLSQKTQWLNTGSSPVTTYTYDETGQVTSMTDPNSNVTSYSYADSFLNTNSSGFTTTAGSPPSGQVTNAYLTQITYPTTNNVSHVENFSYGYNDGELTQSVDENGQATKYKYNDLLGRLTEQDYPDLGQTEFAYNDAPPSPSVTTCQLINGTAGANCSAASPPSGWKTSVSTMDGIGHVVQTELVSDPDGPTYSVTTYDGNSRPYIVYNPTRCSPPTTNCGTETTWGYTTYTDDALGRTTNVAEPDGSSNQMVYDQACSVNGSTPIGTTVTDEVGNQRQSCSDGLGRLTGVYEAPNISGYDFLTQYTYDPLNDLTNVTQNGNNSSNARVRAFVYDSLARLTSATNPESGNITYSYDPNGNMLSKVAPKTNQTGTAQTTTSYTYDSLNRLTGKTYSNPTSPKDLYGYDGVALTGCPGPDAPTISGATNLVGRRSAMCGNKSSSAWSYDSMGRSLFEMTDNKGTSTVGYTVGYTYWEDGSLQSLTYPSGDVLNYSPGGAGRALGVSDSATDYVANGTGAGRAMYAPQGALASMVNGYTSSFAGIVTSNLYNDRLQPLLLSASDSSGALFSLCYDFHLGIAIASTPCNISAYKTGDNGNVFQVLNQVDSTRSTAYIYDPLNRIAQAYTLNTSGPNCWGETYSPTATAQGVLPTTPGIDAWGNLTNRSGVTGMGTCTTEGLSATATTQNQLSGIGMTYDASGNVTNDGNGNEPTYDDENRIATDQGYTYSYDADGMRMEKASGSTGTMYWIGTQGENLTETDLTGAINEEYVYFNGQRIARIDRPSGTVNYYFSNHLGSASVITSATGGIQEQTDFYPFGGIAYISGGDPNHYKFTGKERDAESGLDYFINRHYGSSLGRFMQPDPIFFQAEMLTDPQRFNQYAYVRNNPLALVDPKGEAIELTCSSTDANTCAAQRQQQLQALQQAVGQQAGSYLYQNAVTTTDANGNSTTKYYVGVYTNGPSGQGPAFGSINSASEAIGNIISDSRVAQLNLVPAGTTITNNLGETAQIGPIGRGSPGATYVGQDGQLHVTLLDTSTTSPGQLPPDYMSNGQPGIVDAGILAGHEFGHVRYEWGGFWRHALDNSNSSAVRLENDVRKLRDPNAPTRTEH